MESKTSSSLQHEAAPKKRGMELLRSENAEAYVVNIIAGNQLLGLIVRREYCQPGIHFFNKDTDPQQLGYLNYPAGRVIAAHRHKPVTRSIVGTPEVLLVKSGVIRADFYDSEGAYVESFVLRSGDLVIMLDGGHGFRVIEDMEMIEVKQGPYCEGKDKEPIEAVEETNVCIRE